jgi:pimeloyl-ACP methyl ester carboxylesterase
MSQSVNPEFTARLQDKSATFARETVAGSEALMIVFGGIKLGLGMPPFEFFQLTRDVPTHKLFLRDLHQAWYHRGMTGVGGSIAEVTEFLKREINATGAKRIAVFGNSMGGYAALLLGALIKAHVVHAFAPQTFLGPWQLASRGDFRWKRDIWRVYFSREPRTHWDLRKTVALSGTTQFHIHYGAENKLDAVHAQHLGDCSNVSLHGHADSGHRVVKALRDSGELAKIIERALAR